jgi:hypothetical protein
VLCALLGLELCRPALVTQVVTDAQRVALQLLDGQDGLALVGAVGAGAVHRRGLRRGAIGQGSVRDALSWSMKPGGRMNGFAPPSSVPALPSQTCVRLVKGNRPEIA